MLDLRLKLWTGTQVTKTTSKQKKILQKVKWKLWTPLGSQEAASHNNKMTGLYSMWAYDQGYVRNQRLKELTMLL